jgi:hypothetical protein
LNADLLSAVACDNRQVQRFSLSGRFEKCVLPEASERHADLPAEKVSYRSAQPPPPRHTHRCGAARRYICRKRLGCTTTAAAARIAGRRLCEPDRCGNDRGADEKNVANRGAH